MYKTVSVREIRDAHQESLEVWAEPASQKSRRHRETECICIVIFFTRNSVYSRSEVKRFETALEFFFVAAATEHRERFHSIRQIYRLNGHGAPCSLSRKRYSWPINRISLTGYRNRYSHLINARENNIHERRRREREREFKTWVYKCTLRVSITDESIFLSNSTE